MIRQSKHNRSDSQVSEFQKSMLNKLDSLCSPSPTFESVDSEASSSFDSTNKSSNLRRRRLYHSPGAIGVLQSPGVDPAAAARADRDAKRKSIGNVLAERARLVQRTLIRGALASQQSSTPVRPAPSTRVNSLGADERPKTGAAVQNASAPVRLAAAMRSAAEEPERPTSGNMILNSLTILESTYAENGLRAPVGTTSDLNPSQCDRGALSMASESVNARESSSPNSLKRKRSKSSPHEDSLSLTAFSTKRKRNDPSVQWFVLVCSSIKRLVEYVPLSSENISRCICLQLALAATKPVTLEDSDWLPEFIEHIAQLVEAAGECSCHKRTVRSALRKQIPKPSRKKGHNVLDEENMKKLVGWLQDSRALLMERLTRNMQLLL